MKHIIKYMLPAVFALASASCDKNEHYINEVASTPNALLFEAGFAPDGGAYDKTGTLDVAHFEGSQLFTRYNEHFLLHSAHFNGTPGQTTGSGFYKVPYSSSQEFVRGISDGFSIELIFSPVVLANSALLTSFVSESSEGFGLELVKEGELKFSVATTDGLVTGLSRQDTGHGIAAGNWYHVVATWDFNESLMKLYINGSQWQINSSKATSLPTSGNLVLPSSSAKKWIGIGAAPIDNNNYAGRTFCGEIAVARIYDNVLYSDQIKQMFYTALYTGAPKPLAVSQIAFRTPCKVAHGNRYHIYGDGFAAGDSILFTPRQGGKEFSCEAVLNAASDGVSVVLPEALQSGAYDMTLFRADRTKTLGAATFELSRTPDFEVKTGILAHRCVHGSDIGIPENSLAGLRETQRRGYYGAEFDVYITADSDPADGVDDGEVVVCHDVTYNGTNLETSTYAQVSALRLSNGEAFPTLDSFLKQGKEGTAHLTFEIKNHSKWENTVRCADKVIDLVEANGYTRDMYTVTSFNIETLKYLRSKVGKDRMHLAHHGELSPEELDALQIDGIACAMKVLSEHPDWIRKAREMGMSTTVWTPGSVEDLTTFIGLEVNSVTVNDVDLAQKCIGRVYLSEN